MPSRPTVTSPRGQGFDTFRQSPLEHVRILYVAFVKGLFQAAPAGQYHWSAGAESEIYISDENPIQASVVGQRPAISFTRGPVQFYSLGIGDLDQYRFDLDREQKSVLLPGVMSINCCSRNDLESERLAWIVAEHLWLLRKKLIGSGKLFEVGRQATISSPSGAGALVAADGADEWYCTTVKSPFQLPRTSQVMPLNQNVLQSVELQLTTARTQLDNQGWPASGNADRPVGVVTTPPQSFAPAATDTWGRTPNPGGDPETPGGRDYDPLNPTAQIRIRSVNPYKPGLPKPSINGRTLPIAESSMTESSVNPVRQRVKI